MYGKRFRAVGTHGRDATISSATELTRPSGANTLMISAEAQAVRVRLDGSAATATEGFLIPANEWVYLPVSGIDSVSVIEDASGGIVQYQWGESW